MDCIFKFDDRTDYKMAMDVVKDIKIFFYDALDHYKKYHPDFPGFDLSTVQGVTINFSSDMSLYSYIIYHPWEYKEEVLGIYIRDDQVFIFLDIIYDDFVLYFGAGKRTFTESGHLTGFTDDDVIEHIACVVSDILFFRCIE